MEKKFTTSAPNWLSVTLDEAIDFLEENGTVEDKKEFKKWLFSTKEGKASKKANWGNARYKFLEKYLPEMLPEKKAKENKSARVLNW